MAKTSMNIKADSTLVTGATRAALGNVPLDNTEMWDGLVEEYGTLMDSIAKDFGEVTTKLSEYKNELKSSIEEGLKQASDGTLSENVYEDEVEIYEGFKKKFRETKGRKNREERRALEREVNKHVNNRRRTGEDVVNMSKTIQSDEFDANLTGSAALDFVTQVMDWHTGRLNTFEHDEETGEYKKGTYKPKGEGALEVGYEDGERVYSFTHYPGIGQEPVTFTKVKESDIPSLIKTNRNATSVKYQTLINNEMKRGKSKNTEYVPRDRQALIDDIKNDVLQTPEDFQYMAFKDQAGKKSLYNTLMRPSKESAQIFGALATLYPEKDTNKDGKLTQEDFGDTKDFKTKENYKKFVDNLTRPFKNGKKNKEFNQEVSYNLLADYLADDGKVFFDRGKGLIDKKVVDGKDEETKGSTFGNKYLDISGDGSYNVSGSALTGWADQMNKKATIDFGGDGKYVWNDKKSMYMLETPDGTQEIPSKKSMILSLTNQDRLSNQFQSMEAYKNIQDWFTPREDTSNKPVDQEGNIVQNGLMPKFFTKDDDDQMKILEKMLPPNYIVEETYNDPIFGMGFGFGVRISDPQGNVLGTYQFDRDAEDALAEAERFNTEIAQKIKGFNVDPLNPNN